MLHETLSIGASHNNKISIEETKITANYGLEYPRLIIPVRLDLNPLDQVDEARSNFVIQSVHAGLCLKKNNAKISDSIAGSFPYTVSSPNQYITYSLEFPLDNKQIAKIEEERRGNIELIVTLRLLLGFYEYTSISRFDDISKGLDVTVPQSHWVDKVLPDLGFGSFFIVEIPAGDRTIQKAWKYIELAEASFNNWNSKAVFANCRELGNLLDETIKKTFGPKSFAYQERWGRMYSRFSHWASLDLHLEGILNKSNQYAQDEVMIRKSDAENLLIRAKATLKFAEELLKER